MDKFSVAYGKFTISQNGLEIRSTDYSYDYHNAYGTKAINTNSNNHYQWTIAYTNLGYDLLVGISATRDVSVNADCNVISYAYQTSLGYKYTLGSLSEYTTGSYAKSGTVVCTVDCADQTIKFNVDGKDCGIAYSNIKPGTYYLAVSLSRGADVTIRDFLEKEEEEEEKEEKEEEEEEEQSESEEMRLLKEWNLDRYAKVLIEDEGYDDCTYWKDLSVEELKQMGFKTGHAKKFSDKSANI